MFAARGIVIIPVFVGLLSFSFFVVRLYPYVARPTAGFMAYYTAGKLLTQHYDLGILYDGKKFHDLIPRVTNTDVEDEYRANPPALAIFFSPLSFVSAPTAKCIWEICSLLAVIVSLVLLKTYFHFETNEFWMLSALTFSFTPLYISFVYGQLYAFLFLLHVILLVYWQSKKIFAPVALGLLLLLKGYGVIFLIVALFLKNWRLFFSSLAAYFVLFLISASIVGFNTWLAYISALIALLSSPPLAVTFQQNVQSCIAFFVQRVIHNGVLSPVDNSVIFSIVGALFIGGIGITLWCARGSEGLSPLIPLSAAVIVGVFFSPQLFDYHYTFFLIPVFGCYKELCKTAGRTALGIFAIALFLLSVKIPYYYPIFQTTWLGYLGFPRIYGGLLLLILMVQMTNRNVHPSMETASH